RFITRSEKELRVVTASGPPNPSGQIALAHQAGDRGDPAGKAEEVLQSIAGSVFPGPSPELFWNPVRLCSEYAHQLRMPKPTNISSVEPWPPKGSSANSSQTTKGMKGPATKRSLCRTTLRSGRFGIFLRSAAFSLGRFRRRTDSRS